MRYRADGTEGSGSLACSITGMGLATPLGANCTENLTSVRQGTSGLKRGSVPGVYSERPFPIAPPPEVSLDAMRSPKSQKYMTVATRLAMAAAMEAVETSGIQSAFIEPARLGIYTGSGQTGLEFGEFFPALEYAWSEDREHDYKYIGGRASRLMDPYFSLRTLSNAAVALISAETGARGVSSNFVHCDSAGGFALSTACYDLLEDRCDAVIVGAYDNLLLPNVWHAFEKAGLISSAEEDPAVRPYDRYRCGLVPGAAAAFLVLERRNDAVSRGASIYADIRAIDCSSATELSEAFEFSPRFRKALDRLTLDYIVGRGLGTQDHDATELKFLAEFTKGCCPVTALKGFTGYTGSATALQDLAIGVLCARDGIIPQVAGLTSPERADVDLVCGNARKLENGHHRGLFIASSLGGQTSGIVVETNKA